MTICFLSLYSGINDRGAESFVHQLASQLSKKHDVKLFSGGQPNINGVQVTKISLSVSQPLQGFVGGPINNLRKRIFLDSGNLSVLRFTLKLIPYLWRTKPRVIVPVNGLWQVFITRLITMFYGGKVLITGHSGLGWDERWNLYLFPNVFVATTEPTAAWAKRTWPFVKIVTIPYGIDLDRYLEAAPAKLSLASPVVLCPSAAVEYKRINLAIDAVSKLSKGSLLHLGTGHLISTIKDYGHNKLSARFLSRAVPQVEMPTFYAAVDVVTLSSSLQENSPMVFLEALAAGKPVVATDTPRNRWLLGEAGRFVNPEDTDAYASALSEAISDPRKDLVMTERKRFSWPTILSKYENLLQSLS